jgi:hypothetical protein
VSDKVPQPTAVLVKRLRRVAQLFDHEATCFHTPAHAAQFQARANTCWQAAARLEDLDAAIAIAEPQETATVVLEDV